MVHPTKQYHPIDERFRSQYKLIAPDLLIYGRWLTRSNVAAMDLQHDAVEATITGVRRWPVGITLKKHLRDAMLSIWRNKRKNKSELVIQRDPNAELVDPSADHPVSPYSHNPEECLDDAQGTELAEEMAGAVFAATPPGSLQRAVCEQARLENHKVARVAEMLGVTPAQVSEARRQLRVNKVVPILRRYGIEVTKKNTGTDDGEDQ